MTPRPPLFRKTRTADPRSSATDALSNALLGERCLGLHWAAYNWTGLGSDGADRLFGGLITPNSDDVDLHWELVDAVDRRLRAPAREDSP